MNVVEFAITSCAVTECVNDPLEPVNVNVYVPSCTAAPAVTITDVDRVDDVNGFVTNVAAVAFGKPDTDNVTFPENPFSGAIDTVNTVASVGYNGAADDTDNEKSPDGAASATAAHDTPATARTASNATSGLRLALPDALLNNLPAT